MRSWKCLFDEREGRSGEQEVTEVVGADDEDSAYLPWTPGLPVAGGCANVHRSHQRLPRQHLAFI